MDNWFQGSSEAEEIQNEGLTTPGTAFTSPWIGTNRSPDTGFVNTVTQSAWPVVNAYKYPEPSSTQAMSPADKVDSWFASNSAEPSQSLTTRPITRDIAFAAPAGTQGQLLNHKATGPSTQDLLRDPVFGEQNEPRTPQMDVSTVLHSSPSTDKCKLVISRSDSGNPFFDSVPKGPSQLSTSRWNVRAPAFGPGNSARGQATTSSSTCYKTETPARPGENVQGIPRPQLSLRIPDTPIGSDSFRSVSQMATHPVISDSRSDAPHTADSLVATARRFTPSIQGTQHQATQGGDILDPAATPFQSKSSFPRAPVRRTNHTLMQPIAASHTSSKTWTSNLIVEKERWQRVEDSLGRMNFLRSSIVPKTLKDWLVHQRGRTDAKKKREQGKLEDMNPSPRDPRLPPPSRPVKIGPAFRGRAFEHSNYGSVLVFPSVWARMYEPPAERPDSLWPCIEEMKEEGDERNTSGFRRFPALPRVRGNNTVQYKLKAIQPFLPFDAIWELPTKESVEAANEKYAPAETEVMENYLGRSLLDALDCITEDSY